MKPLITRVRVAALTLLMVGVSMLVASVASAQTPDLSGVWLPSSGKAPTGPRVSQHAQRELSFTPDGLARFNANKPGKGPRQAPPAFGNDPVGDANPFGLLRSFIDDRLNQIVMLPDSILQLFETGHFWRTIWTDGRALPDDPDPRWYGYSVGRWEGDTLVVQTVGLDSRAWMDEWGTPFSEETKITERWRKTDANTLQLTITVNDPRTFTAPWTSDPRIYKKQAKGTVNGEVPERIFAPIDEQEFNRRIRNPAGGRQ